MNCTRCGSGNVLSQTVTDTSKKEKVKGFGWIKACLGFLLFSFPGILCGLCGMGKGKTKTTTTTRIEYVCRNCGNRW